ncbi:alpha/beta fold hydrolase [Streptomyces sp. NPDC101490]|uniref:alpha/beta fold hydrolase n=1 Tax=Streptomyces sp. NPDC101490 TaxID=3366143 RepID=UPI0037F857E3
MGMSSVRRRISTAAAIPVAICAVAASAAPAAVASAPASASAVGKGAKPTVVLVHGAFADASGWNAVAERLLDQGYPVIAPPNPLRGLSNDAAYVASVLKSVKGPIVLAGHSYGGAVITQAGAGNPNVKALVYVSAFMPDIGESPAELSTKFTGSELGPALNPVPYSDATGSGTDLYIKPDRFHAVFAADLPASRTRLMAAEQRPVTEAGFAEKATAAAWKTTPSWFVVSARDKAIAPDLERFEAKRAKAHTVEIESSHVSMMSHPDVVTEQIRDAAATVTGADPKPAALARTGSRTTELALAGGLAAAFVATGTALAVWGRRRART